MWYGPYPHRVQVGKEHADTYSNVAFARYANHLKILPTVCWGMQHLNCDQGVGHTRWQVMSRDLHGGQTACAHVCGQQTA